VEDLHLWPEGLICSIIEYIHYIASVHHFQNTLTQRFSVQRFQR
jgi:hypothetical protein